MGVVSPEDRGALLPLLAELGTEEGLVAVESVAIGNDPERVKEAVRVLALWPNAAPAWHLLTVTGGSEP